MAIDLLYLFANAKITPGKHLPESQGKIAQVNTSEEVYNRYSSIAIFTSVFILNQTKLCWRAWLTQG